jgi:hypothetical protein
MWKSDLCFSRIPEEFTRILTFVFDMKYVEKAKMRYSEMANTKI